MNIIKIIDRADDRRKKIVRSQDAAAGKKELFPSYSGEQLLVY
jgi:hypothetical protein